MGDFLKTYGPWIAVGVLFLLMLRLHSFGRHGGGGGCGGSEGQRRSDGSNEEGAKSRAADGGGHGRGGCH